MATLSNAAFTAFLNDARQLYLQAIGEPTSKQVLRTLCIKQIALTNTHCIVLTVSGRVFAGTFAELTQTSSTLMPIDEGMTVQQILAFDNTVYFLLTGGRWRYRTYCEAGYFSQAGWGMFYDQKWSAEVSHEPVKAIFSMYDICFIATINRLWVKTTNPGINDVIKDMISPADQAVAISAEKFVSLQVLPEILFNSIQSIALGGKHILLYTQIGEYGVGKLSEHVWVSSFTNMGSLKSRSGSPSSASSSMSKSTVSLDALETIPMVQFSVIAQPVQMGPWNNNFYPL